MTGYCPNNSAIVRIHEREMEFLRLMANAGIAVAVPAALHYCHEHKYPVPDWLSKAAIDLLCELLKSEKPTRRGRTATHVARHRQDNIDFTRWSTVIWQRDAQQQLLEQVKTIREWPGEVPATYRSDREKLQEWLGTSLDRAFECAAMLLEGNEAYGSPDAMKRSYFKVQRAQGDLQQAIRYHQLDPHFLMKIGIKWEPFVRPGRKMVPVYKLSL